MAHELLVGYLRRRKVTSVTGTGAKVWRLGSALFAALAATLFFAAPSGAAIVDLNSSQRGWIRSDDNSEVIAEPANNNYFVGEFAGTDLIGGTTTPGYHDFFAFDLTGLTGSITGATLHLFNPKGGYDSLQQAETLEIFLYSIDPATIAQLSSLAPPPPAGTYLALTAGTLVGSIPVTVLDDNSFIDIVLNADALAALNAAAASTDMIAFAGGLDGLLQEPDGSASTRGVFESTGNDTNNPADGLTQLILTVPEPSSCALIVAGLVGLGLVRRRSPRARSRAG